MSSKLTIPGICLLLFLGCKPEAKDKNTTPSENATPCDLAKMIQSLKGWSSEGTYFPESFSTDDWNRYKKVATKFQGTDEQTVREAFQKFMEDHGGNSDGTYEEDSKPYFLLRIMFDIPNDYESSLGTKGWNTRDPNSKYLMWPLEFDSKTNKFRILEAWRGSMGPPYHLEKEFDLMLNNFNHRKLVVNEE